MKTVTNKKGQVERSEWEGKHLLFASTMVENIAKRVAGGIIAIAICNSSPNRISTRHVRKVGVAEASLSHVASRQRQVASIGWEGD